MGHVNVDPDAIASIYGIKFILENIVGNAEIDILIDGVNKTAQDIIDFYDSNFLSETNKKYDLIIIVDVNVLNQLGSFKKLVKAQKKDSLIIIDHHTPTDFANEKASLVYIDEDRTSAAEIITELIFDLNLVPNEKLLTVLLSGILYDSRRFYHMNNRLLSILSKMFEHGVDYDLAVSILQKKIDYPQRVARLKAASRLRLKIIDKWLIAWSKIGSYEGSVGRSFLELGADVAFVYSGRKKDTRLSVRATSEFHIKTGVNFGRDIMKKLGDFFGGEGGGHSTAAALNIPKIIDEKALRNKALNILENCMLENKKNNES